MKARQDFTYFIDLKTKSPTSVSGGDSLKNVKIYDIKKGDEIPKAIESYIAMYNPEFVELSTIPKGTKKAPPRYGRGPLYTRENLSKVYNENGMKGLKEIGEKFGVTDRSHAKLITEIIKAQEKKHERKR